MDFKQENNKLYVQKAGRWESIGTLRDKVFFVSRDYSTQLMKYDNTYGFNQSIIGSNLFDYIQILETKDTETNKYFIPTDWITTHGRSYTAPDEEPQLFIKWEAIQEFKQ